MHIIKDCAGHDMEKHNITYSIQTQMETEHKAYEDEERNTGTQERGNDNN